MNILLLNGSPKGKNSNTAKIAAAFIEGMGPGHQVQQVDIRSANIHPCCGCFRCWTHTPGECVYQDDMPSLLLAYRQADVVVWSFPLYYYSMPSGIKAFMDRLLPLNQPYIVGGAHGTGSHPGRYDLSGQKYVLLSSCGFHAVQRNYDGVLAQFETLYGQQLSRILCPQGELLSVPELGQMAQGYLAQVKEAGEEFVRTGAVGADTSHRLAQPMVEAEAFMQMANAQWDISLANQNPDPHQGAQQQARGFLQQMAALCNPAAVGRDIVLEMAFTDLETTYQLVIAQGKCTLMEPEDRAYTTRIETSFGLWQDIAAGRLDGAQAMMERKYRVLGDFNLMMEFGSLFPTGAFQSTAQESSHSQEQPPQEKKSNMAMLVIPWMSLWTLAPIHPQLGAVAAIVLSLLLLLNNRFRRTPYETASAVALTAMGVGILLQAGPLHLVLAAGKLVWAAMWLVSAGLRVPLCAYYSCNGHGFAGPEQAFANPLFLRTNRILAVLWGAMSLVMSAVALAVLQTPYGAVFGLVDSLLPLFLGGFTLWFAKWYPGYYAGKAVAR